MRNKYETLTSEMFSELLHDIVGEMGANEILAYDGVMAIFSEELNNEVLERWEQSDEGAEAIRQWLLRRVETHLKSEGFTPDENTAEDVLSEIESHFVSDELDDVTQDQVHEALIALELIDADEEE